VDGLFTRDYLDTKKIPYKYNDEKRLEGYPNSISFSIEFPNEMLFYYLRKKLETNWVVLVYDAKILNKFDCSFCYTNAANSKITSENIIRLKSDVALEDMFSDIYGRRDGLPDNHTTDIQAEVLCFNNISSDYLKAIVFTDEEDAEYIFMMTGKNTIYHKPRQGFFGIRSCYAKWYKINGL
jgi:hypothetical protein